MIKHLLFRKNILRYLCILAFSTQLFPSFTLYGQQSVSMHPCANHVIFPGFNYNNIAIPVYVKPNLIGGNSCPNQDFEFGADRPMDQNFITCLYNTQTEEVMWANVGKRSGCHRQLYNAACRHWNEEHIVGFGVFEDTTQKGRYYLNPRNSYCSGQFNQPNYGSPWLYDDNLRQKIVQSFVDQTGATISPAPEEILRRCRVDMKMTGPDTQCAMNMSTQTFRPSVGRASTRAALNTFGPGMIVDHLIGGAGECGAIVDVAWQNRQQLTAGGGGAATYSYYSGLGRMAWYSARNKAAAALSGCSLSACAAGATCAGSVYIAGSAINEACNRPSGNITYRGCFYDTHKPVCDFVARCAVRTVESCRPTNGWNAAPPAPDVFSGGGRFGPQPYW